MCALVREVVKAKGAGAYRLFGQPAHLGDVVRCRRLAADLTLAHHIDAQRVMRDLCRHIAPSDLGVAIRRSVLPAETAITDWVASTARKQPVGAMPEIVNSITDRARLDRRGWFRGAMSMDAEAILHELTHTAGLPTEALQAASAQRAEMLPKFLGVIEDYLSREPSARANPTPLFFIFHLLGEWREKIAYRPLARLLRCPEDEVVAIFGDAITSTSHRVMAAVFDGDPQPLCDIILDPEAEEFVRASMCEALAMVTLRGELDRVLTGRFLRDAYNELLPQRHCYVWVGWQNAIAMLGMGELKVLVKRAFNRGFIDPYVLHFDDFEQNLKRGSERPDELQPPDDDEYTPFGDTVEELSGWHCFAEQHSEDLEEWRQLDEFDRLLGEPHRNPFKGIGRNDLCPCGSGKKFKKCCLQRAQVTQSEPVAATRLIGAPPVM